MTSRFAQIRAGGDHRRPQLITPGPQEFYRERERASDLAQRLSKMQQEVADRDTAIKAKDAQIAALQKQLVQLQAAAQSTTLPTQDPPVKRGPGRPRKHAR